MLDLDGKECRWYRSLGNRSKISRWIVENQFRIGLWDERTVKEKMSTFLE